MAYRDRLAASRVRADSATVNDVYLTIFQAQRGGQNVELTNVTPGAIPTSPSYPNGDLSDISAFLAEVRSFHPEMRHKNQPNLRILPFKKAFNSSRTMSRALLHCVFELLVPLTNLRRPIQIGLTL